MKKFLVSICSLLLVAGVSGCMVQQNKQPSQEQQQKQQQREKENKANEKAMLSYLRDKYKREFTSIEYTPAKRGFNDGFNENILTAESEDGIRVNVKEKLVHKGRYYDNYTDYVASNRIKDVIDYSGIRNLQVAKNFVTLKILPNYENLKLLESQKFKLSQEMVIKWYSIIAISGEPNEEVLKQLYNVYDKIISSGFGNYPVFIVAFGGDKSKAAKYVNNFLLYGPKDWESFDDKVKAVLKITDEKISFEKFKNQLIQIGG